jgi:hypothetical protein
VDPAHVDAIVDVGRWSGSSMNGQPWRFIIIRDRETITRIHELGVPETRCLRTATTAVAIALPVEEGNDIENAFDDGRAAERMLIAANLLDLGAAVAWVQPELRGAVARLLGIRRRTSSDDARPRSRPRQPACRNGPGSQAPRARRRSTRSAAGRLTPDRGRRLPGYEGDPTFGFSRNMSVGSYALSFLRRFVGRPIGGLHDLAPRRPPSA